MKRDSFIKLPLSWLLFALIWFPPPSANGQTYSCGTGPQGRRGYPLLDHHGRGFRSVEQGVKGKYPFTVRHIRLGPAQQLARIMQEQRSGQFLADVVYNNLLHLIYLKESGFWENASPKPEDFKDRPLRDDELKT